jgi:hypothetical protein
MKSVLFASAAAVAVLAAAPAFAETAPTGYVGTSYSTADSDIAGDMTDWNVDGAAAFNVSDKVGVQINADYSNMDFDGLGSADSWGGSAHLFTRNDSYAVGGYVGMTALDGANEWNVGAEGMWFSDATTFAASAGYGQIEDVDLSYWGYDAEIRYFVNDNFRLQGSLGFNRVDISGAQGNVWSLGLGGEYQFDKAPVSVFAGYSRGRLEMTDLATNTFTVGVRYNFGGTTLKSRERSGAGFNAPAGLSAFLPLF